MEKSSTVAQKVNTLVRKILEENNFLISSETNSADKENNVDFTALRQEESIAHSRYAISYKVYSSQSVPNAVIKAAIRSLLYSADINLGIHRGILAVTSKVEPKDRVALENEFKISIIDRNVLSNLTRGNPELKDLLEEILSEINPLAEEQVDKPDILRNYNFKERITAFDRALKINDIIFEGAALGQKLKIIPTGGENAHTYEIRCEEILKFLFEKDFTSWTQQQTTIDTLHRFDLIAKIAYTNDIWKALATDFKSRFVIFEFKNYKEKITQSEIYSTEKYLYSTAFRTIAIIISREGASKNAETAAYGSLRENGKLIVCLSDDDICEMLHAKDRGDVPSQLILDKVDNMLIGLSK